MCCIVSLSWCYCLVVEGFVVFCGRMFVCVRVLCLIGCFLCWFRFELLVFRLCLVLGLLCASFCLYVVCCLSLLRLICFASCYVVVSCCVLVMVLFDVAFVDCFFCCV